MTAGDGGAAAAGDDAGRMWWSRRFLDVLGSFTDHGRLHRGWTYARQGRVKDLRVRPHEVSARVFGPEPYGVAIGVGPIDEGSWRAVAAELASQPLLRARLLEGETPPELEWAFAQAGVPLLPDSPHDLHLMCECPGYGEPCEHAAAVLCLLAEAFDRDPSLLLTWRGGSRERLLHGLRQASAKDAPDPFDVGDEPLRAAGFWTAGPAPAEPREHAAPAPPDLLLQLLDPPAIKIRRRPLTDVLRPAYEAMSRA